MTPLLLGLIAALLGAVAGAIVGSFIATLVLRWPQGEQAATGRSRCDGCGVAIRPADLIPIWSRFRLKGCCRACGAAIDPLHGRVELAAAAIGGLALAIAPTMSGAMLALFGWLLLPSIILDWRHFWLPDRLTALLAVVGLGAGHMLGIPLQDRLIGGAAGWGALAALGFAYRHLRQREGLGRGDPKLFGAIGLWIGWAPLAPMLALAAALGLAFALRRGLSSKDPLPFGPMIGAAGWIAAAVLVASA